MSGHARLRLLNWLLMLSCCWTATVFAQEDEAAEKLFDFLEVEHALSMDFETPHTKWAKPYAQGATKVLFFAPWFQGSTEGREIIELMQRFDLDAQSVYFEGTRFIGDGRQEWYGGDPEAGTKRVKRLMAEPNHVYFINQLDWEKLPEWLRADMEAKVKAGAGLVFVGDKKQPNFEGSSIDAASRRLPTKGQFLNLTGGRVALLPQRERLAFDLGWETQLDHQLEEQGKAILWAAGHLPRQALEIKVEALDRTELPREVVQIALNGDFPPDAQIVVELQRADGVKISLGTHAPEAHLHLTLPVLPAGTYHLNAFLRDASGVLAWATEPFAITTKQQVDDVVLLKDFAERGETVEGFVAVPAALAAGQQFEARLIDSHGRILASTKPKRAGSKAGFSFKIEEWMPMLLRVEGAIVDEQGDVHSDYAWLRVPHRNRDQFNFVVWNFPGGDLAPYGVQSMAKYGTTVFLQGGPPPLHLAAAGTSYIPYAASFRINSRTITGMLDASNGHLRTGCVHDDAAMMEQVRKVVEGSAEARKLGVFAYSLGDENAVRASCLSPQCLLAYQNYLRAQYQEIAALNKAWNADYRDFSEIELLDEGDLPSPEAPQWFKEYFEEWKIIHSTDSDAAKGDDLPKQLALGDINDEMRALQAGNYARWYDRQAFQSYSYLVWCRRYREAFKQLDPQAWTGFEGTDSFTIRRHTTRSRQGGDLDAFVRETDYYGSYTGPGNEVLRSIAPPKFPRGSWMGYTPDVEKILREYWEQVTDGMNTIQWWRWDNLSGYHGYIAPSFSLFPSTRELFEDTQMARDGLGTLLMHSEMQDDGIAMLYSMPSTHIAHFDGNETYGLYKRDHDEWHKQLHDAGLQFSYVTDRMLRQGEWDYKKYKVLLLPLAFAMGEAEAKVIREFVEQGGTVIADVRPALYDGHCKPLKKGLLDDLFGIERTGNRAARVVDRLAVDKELNGQPLSMRWGDWHGKPIYPQVKIDPSVKVTTGKALGEAFQEHYWAGLNAPLVIHNPVGKGHAILLNFSIYEAPLEKLLPSLLSASGVTRQIVVADTAGAPLRKIEITRWQNGNIQLFSLLGDQEGEAVISLPLATNIYDLRTKQHLGKVSQFPYQLHKNRAAFFAMLPEAPKPPQIQARSRAQRGDLLDVKLAQPGAHGKHAVLLTLQDPQGQQVEWYRQIRITNLEPERLEVPFALNDSPGTWNLVATDLYTGQESRHAITVK